MPNFKQRSYQKELMDLGNFTEKDFRQNLYELKLTNLFLGGHAATLNPLKIIFRKYKQEHYTIADVASGGGDSLVAMAKWCKKNGHQVDFTGIDLNEFCTQFASEEAAEFPNINFITKPYQETAKTYDIITCALFTHHLNEEELDHYLLWAKEKAKIGFIINDLHRHPLAYFNIKWISWLFPFSYLYKNDAPLSVLRSFTKADWQKKAEKLGLEIEIKWHWAFRYSVCYLKK
jgi:2-polyprenyl-3-methyl-5-hydroxy-6-metoxy-1,4-benzoquinol methylase